MLDQLSGPVDEHTLQPIRSDRRRPRDRLIEAAVDGGLGGRLYALQLARGRDVETLWEEMRNFNPQGTETVWESTVINLLMNKIETWYTNNKRWYLVVLQCFSFSYMINVWSIQFKIRTNDKGLLNSLLFYPHLLSFSSKFITSQLQIFCPFSPLLFYYLHSPIFWGHLPFPWCLSLAPQQSHLYKVVEEAEGEDHGEKHRGGVGDDDHWAEHDEEAGMVQNILFKMFQNIRFYFRKK